MNALIRARGRQIVVSDTRAEKESFHAAYAHIFLAVLGSVLLAPAAYAAAESFTVSEKGVTESFTDVLPCVSDSADVTITYNSVFHVTELDNGSYHVTGTLAGTFTAVADGVTYTGHFAQWFGENQNTRNSEGTTTFIVNGRSADGTRISFSEVFHYQITATGVETSFDKPLCH
jgi:hypothetical protein